MLKLGIQLERVVCDRLCVCFHNKLIAKALLLKDFKRCGRARDTTLGRQDLNTLRIVQHEVDQHRCFLRISAVLGDRERHGDLGKAALIIAKLEVFADDEFLIRLVGGLYDRLLILGRGRIPLKDTCVLAVDPLRVLIDGVSHITAQNRDRRHYVLFFHLADEIHAFLNLFCGVLKLIVLYPRLVVLGLQIMYQEDRAVILAHRQRIIAVVISLERRACCQQGILISRKSRADLVKRGLVPVEQTSGQGDRNRHLFAAGHTSLKRALRELGQIQNIRIIVQIQEVLTISRVRLDPVPVDLHHIRRAAAKDIHRLRLLPAGPCAILSIDGDVRIFRLESRDRRLSRLMSGVAAPP